jgi:thiamine biosynthesis protein ThiS
MVKLNVNGKEVEVDLLCLDQLVAHYNLKEEHVVAEVDGEIVDRSRWSDYELKSGSTIELVHFVGGG